MGVAVSDQHTEKARSIVEEIHPLDASVEIKLRKLITKALLAAHAQGAQSILDRLPSEEQIKQYCDSQESSYHFGDCNYDDMHRTEAALWVIERVKGESTK
jgi:hypothetical protein